MADNPLATIKIDDMKDQVSAQLKTFMMSLIPKEAFDKVIEGSWERLTKPRKVNRGNSYTPQWVEEPSELDEMVMNEMRKQIVEKIKAWGEEWRKTYDAEEGAKQVLSELVNQAAGAFIHNAARGIVHNAVEALLRDNDGQRMNCKKCFQPTAVYTTCRCGHYNDSM